MSWEYACLLGKGTVGKNGWYWTYTFHSPAGAKTIGGAGYLAVLNELGQEGWELVATEPRYAFFREDFADQEVASIWRDLSQTLVERTFFFRRPLNGS